MALELVNLSNAIGCEVDITIRGENRFTFSVDRVDNDLEYHLISFFGDEMKLDGETSIDDECGTFVYMRVA